MQNLRDIEKRINSVSSTKQITRTMEMVATAKIRRATDRMVQATPYTESIVEMLEYLYLRIANPDNALLRAHDEVKNSLILVIASDRGLAGGFNSNVFRQTEKILREKEAQGVGYEVIACGKRASGYFNYRNIKPVLEFRDLSADPTADQAKEIAQYAIAGYIDESFDEVIVVYNHTKNAAEQVLRQRCILPVSSGDISSGQTDIVGGFGGEQAVSAHAKDASAVAAQAAMDAAQSAVKEMASEYTSTLSGDVAFEPNEAAVMNTLLPAYVRSVIYHALIDSAAAEQGARRTAMKAATDNATEMVESLSRIYNRVRQGAITTEITEIVGGAAALEE